MSVERLRVNVFAGAANLPIFVAQANGFFQRHGLEVEVVNTPNSREQMQGLIDGAWAFVHTAPDNVFAWEERTGAGLVACMGGYSGVLGFYAQPQITSLQELRGTAIGVDAPDTGFVYALRAMLQQGGLGPDDYQLEPIGGTPIRFSALREGRTPATLLNAPFDLLAEDLRFRKLSDHTQVFGSYATQAAAVRRDWAQQRGDLVVAYIRAYVAGLTWLWNPANLDPAAGLLAERLGLDRALCRRAVARLLDPNLGFLPAAALDFVGLQTVLQLRARMAGWPSLPPLEKYYDLTWYQRALWAEV